MRYQSSSVRRLVWALPVVALTSAVAQTSPEWWARRGVLTAEAANDFAALNAGQLKHLAYMAWLELDSLPGGAGFEPAFTNAGNDYAAVNIGQLKEIARPFYDRLGSTNAYPWAEGPPGNDYALANIGQAKYLFSFDPYKDTDSDGLPDWWEQQIVNFNASDAIMTIEDVLPEDDFDGDGLTNAEEFSEGSDPRLLDTDGDLLIDGAEIHKYFSSAIKIDTDGDGVIDSFDLLGGSFRTYDQTLLIDFPMWTLHGVQPGHFYEFLWHWHTSSPWPDHPWVMAETAIPGNVSGAYYWDSWRVGPGRNRPSGFFVAGLGDDSDTDGLSDIYEIMVLETFPDLKDSDQNGTEDGEEDFDGDGLTNAQEYNSPLNPGHNPYRGSSNPWMPDTDGDGVCDGPIVPSPYALVAGPDAFPLDPSAWLDTDDDGKPDELHGVSNSTPPLIEDTDDDNDGMPDWWETQYGLDPKDDQGDNGPDGDPDGDQLNNLQEYEGGTNPKVSDIIRSVLPYQTGFEPSPLEAYTLGDLSMQEGWLATPGLATVQDETYESGSQAVRLNASRAKASRYFNDTCDAVEIILHIRLSGSAVFPPAVLPTETAYLISFDPDRGLMAFDGDGNDGGTWVVVPDSLLPDQWVELSIVLNYSRASSPLKTWGVSVVGHGFLMNLGFKNNTVGKLDGLHMECGPTDVNYLDNITIREAIDIPW
jgi:hypothetical protein